MKKSNKKDTRYTRATSLFFLVALLIIPLFSLVFLPSPTSALTTRTLTSDSSYDSSTDISKEGFRLTVCDGPTLPPPSKGRDLNKELNQEYQAKYHRNYVPCDFNGAMLQVQHIINIAIFVGVVMAIIGFFYAGYLYITGTQENIKKAKSIFPKIFGGFIIMLSGWFIVFQILSWLTGEGSGLGALLGK